MKFFILISYQIKNVVDGNSMEMAISKMDIVIRKKLINSMEIYNLITKLVCSQINANIQYLCKVYFIFAVFELKYFKFLLKFFNINVQLDSLHYIDMLILY